MKIKKQFVVFLSIVLLLQFGSVTVWATEIPREMESGKRTLAVVPKEIEMNEKEWEVLYRTNKVRMANDIPPLSSTEKLQRAAGIRKEELKTDFSHTRPDGTQCFTVLDECDVIYSAAGENIASGQRTSEEVINAWWNSEGHRKNILSSDFTHLGVGFVDYNWVQLFTGTCIPIGIELLQDSSKVYELTPNQSIDELGLSISVTCSHGTSYMPVIEEMCTPVNRELIGQNQTITVSYGGHIATFLVYLADHNYSGTIVWDEVEQEDGTVVPIAKIDRVICSKCGSEKTELEVTVEKTESQEPTCEISGKEIYVATVTDENGKVLKNITQTMKEIEIPATGHKFEKSICKICDKLQFKDVTEDAWYYNPVKWAAKEGITSGITEEIFGTNQICLRAEVVTFLWRDAGKPEPITVENSFKDVKESSYYYNAVLWAVQNGITSGLTKETFGPAKECTRGEIVTFLWRNAGEPKPNITENPFKDVTEETYYYDAVLWAVENGITSGLTTDIFAPFKSCMRSEVVTFLYRQFEK